MRKAFLKSAKASLLEMRRQVLEGIEVFLKAVLLAVHHEHKPVNAAQHQFARRVVIDLAGDGVELELRLEAFDFPQVQRKEVEKQRPVLLGRQ